MSMTPARAYRYQRGGDRSQATRERIVDAVRQLLSERIFHESTVEEVADRARVSRATLYQHFDSRLALVDAICETFDENPALVALRQSVGHKDAETALDETIEHAVRFWSSEEAILQELYGVVAVDPSARELVERQRADRRGEIQRLVDRLDASSLLPAADKHKGLAHLMVLTSFETFEELRLVDLQEQEITEHLQHMARRLLIGQARSQLS
jgi:AcrR family transcriptional regulator